MARRPVFSVSQGGYPLFDCEEIGFPYFNGFSTAQKQRCIRSLHQAYLEKHPQAKLLEISSQSETGLGVRLSAFHLTRTLQSGKCVPVEVAFQAGKRFEHGGPYADLLDVPPGKAKNDGRLKNSGDIIGFTCDGVGFAAEPKTFFYNWLYITALQEHRGLLEGLLEYDAFTDIAFNPQKVPELSGRGGGDLRLPAPAGPAPGGVGQPAGVPGRGLPPPDGRSAAPVGV